MKVPPTFFSESRVYHSMNRSTAPLATNVAPSTSTKVMDAPHGFTTMSTPPIPTGHSRRKHSDPNAAAERTQAERANHVHDGQQNEHHAEHHREEPGDHLGKDERDERDDDVEHRRHKGARVAVAHAALTEVRQQAPPRPSTASATPNSIDDALHGNGRVDHQETARTRCKAPPAPCCSIAPTFRNFSTTLLLSLGAVQRPYFGSDTDGHAPPSPGAPRPSELSLTGRHAKALAQNGGPLRSALKTIS